MSGVKKNPLDVSPETLEAIFGGTGSYSNGTLNYTAMTAKCKDYISGSNNYIGMTLRNTCGQCRFFKLSKGQGQCVHPERT